MRRLLTLLSLIVLIVLVAALVPTGASAQVTAPGGFDAAARQAVRALPAATAVNDADGDRLFDTLEAAFALQPSERQRAVVVFRDGVATADGLAAVREVAPEAIIGRTFTVVPSLMAQVTLVEAQQIGELDEVRQVELDVPGTPELDTATESMGADLAVDTLGVSGDLDGDLATVTTTDVGIAVLDSGFHAAHEQLDQGKLTAFIDLGNSRPEPYDDNGHGTHVANIVAGYEAGVPEHRGVAPGAGIIGLKIEGGSGSQSNAIAGFQWIIDNREAYNIRVATISYGFGTATDGTTAIEMVVDAVWDAGVAVFKSTGNSGPGNGTITVPAAARGIIATGSLINPGSGSSTAGYSLSSFSSRGPTTDGRVKPDIAAPGDTIRAAQTGTRDGYVNKSGTSMASPFAAGTAALMFAANPALTPDEMRELMFATAEDFGAEGADNDFGHGRIQVTEAVAEALRSAGQPVPAHTPVLVPHHEGITVTADATGSATAQVEVASSTFPLVVTALGEDGARVVDVSIDAGLLRIAIPGTTRHRSAQVISPAEGTATVTVQTEPFASVVLAVSHSDSVAAAD